MNNIYAKIGFLIIDIVCFIVIIISAKKTGYYKAKREIFQKLGEIAKEQRKELMKLMPNNVVKEDGTVSKEDILKLERLSGGVDLLKIITEKL